MSRQPGSPWPERFRGILSFVSRRSTFLLLLGGVVLLGLVTWRITSKVLESDLPPGGIEPVVDGKFLGIQVDDKTHDEFMSNSWLRLAMNEADKTMGTVRRYQVEKIWLHDGQHPQTGETAVIVVIQPKRNEIPHPPFEPVAVRRWRPPREKIYSPEEFAQRQTYSSPDKQDLDKLRQVWSGNRYAEVKSLTDSFNWVLVGIVAGGILMLLAGAYRSSAFWSTRWDRVADQQHADSALAGLKTARRERESADSMDL